jgi:hypothetical protein
VGPTKFQLQFLLLGKEPTIQARLARCVDELRSRKREVEAIEDEIAETYDRIKLAELDFEDEKKCEDLSFARLMIKKDQMERRRRAAERKIFDNQNILSCRLQEIQFLILAYNELTKAESQKDWDDMNVQLQYWEAKLGQDISNRASVKAPQDMEVLRTAMALPQGSSLKASLQKIIESGNNDGK